VHTFPDIVFKGFPVLKWGFVRCVECGVWNCVVLVDEAQADLG
jgi:hypothetical protein